MNWIQETFLQPTMIQTVAVICIVCAIGVYLGKLKYKEIEPKLIEMYHVQPEEVKRQIISAVADLKTDKALGFLYNAYDEADNWGTKRIILKSLYEYSAMGRKTFDQLERKADSHTAILFAHTRHPLINQLI